MQKNNPSGSYCVRLFGLSIALLLFALITPLSAQLDGTNGADGDPGENGEVGQDAGAIQGSTLPEAPLWFFAVAEHGGNGGNGGAGVDGDDADNDANGGNGGNGGFGGLANSDHSQAPNPIRFRHAFARGGDGGHGGMGGVGTSESLNGIGGDGGHGGNAIAKSDNVTKYSRLMAVGGTGGNAYGFGASAGNGGQTSTSATIVGDINEQSGTFSIQQFGGHGGNGLMGANAGNGAETNLNINSLAISFPSDDQFFSRNLYIRAEGGTGGMARGGGMAGSAGNVVLQLDDLSAQIGNEPSVYYNYQFSLKGGIGGSGSLSAPGHVSGKNGGNATVAGDATFLHTFDNQLSFDLEGGQGGSALGRMNTGNGGHGGSAEMFSFVEVTDGSNGVAPGADFGATLIGGRGGHAQGSGTGGNGGSANLVDSFSIGSSGESFIWNTAKGGNGGSGRIGGHGGDASIVVNESLTEPTRGPFFVRRQVLVGLATGGNAGKGSSKTGQANGGNASVFLKETSQIGVSLSAKSDAGIGFGGRSGNSNARAQAISLGQPTHPFQEGSVGATAFAIAGYQQVSDLGNRRPRYGTIANASALAIASAMADANAHSSATGGWGTAESGHATANSVSENVGTGESLAFSESFSHGDRNASTNNVAQSDSFSRSTNFAESTSKARALGHFNRSIATSSSTGLEASSHSQASTFTRNWAHDSTVTSQIDFTSNSGSIARVDSRSHSAFRTGQFIDDAGIEANAELSVAPTEIFSDSVFDAAPGVADHFSDGDDVLAIGRFRGGSNGESLDGSISVESHVDLALELLDHQIDKNMIMTLFDVESTGDGFNEMFFRASWNDNLVVDQFFTSLDQANSFFDNAVFDLGGFIGVTQSVDWGFDFFLSSDNPDDSFGFKFAIGNGIRVIPVDNDQASSQFGSGTFSSIPEPTGLGFLSVAAVTLFGRRRRKK